MNCASVSGKKEIEEHNANKEKKTAKLINEGVKIEKQHHDTTSALLDKRKKDMSTKKQTNKGKTWVRGEIFTSEQDGETVQMYTTHK